MNSTKDDKQIPPPEEDGLVFAVRLDGEGSATLIDWAEIETADDASGPMWVHLNRKSARAQEWLRNKSGLTAITAEALLAEETRPRVFRGKRGVIAILRGINMNPGESHEDMVDLRIWSDGHKVITLRDRRVMSAQDILAQLIRHGDGPEDAQQLYLKLITRLTDRMSEAVSAFDDRLDDLEWNLDSSDAKVALRKLSEMRQAAVVLRRYISPQREALGYLLSDPPAWFDDHSRLVLRETVDRLLRYVEELDAARERAIVIKDDITNRLAESTDRRLYVLSIISAVFLPLGFLTGLLGINIGGMPGVDNPLAFWIASIVMGAIIVVELIIFRRLKWL